MKTKRKQRGFSLMEILVALTLLAMAIAFVGTKVADSLDRGKVDAARIQIGNFKSVLDDYRRICNQYPGADQGLEALVAKPTTPPDCPNYPSNGFIEGGKVPLDPWQNPYIYEGDGQKYVIRSYGSDRKEGGEDNAKDIDSNNL